MLYVTEIVKSAVRQIIIDKYLPKKRNGPRKGSPERK